jgi:hypothetical protein
LAQIELYGSCPGNEIKKSEHKLSDMKYKAISTVILLELYRNISPGHFIVGGSIFVQDASAVFYY